MQGVFLADADRSVYRMCNIGNSVCDMRNLKLRDSKLWGGWGRQGVAAGGGRHLQCHIGSAYVFGHFADLVLHGLKFAYRPAKLLALGSVFQCEFEGLFHGAYGHCQHGEDAEIK